MTTLTITPNLAKKTAKFAGAVAAGEHVAVTLKYGASIADTANLRLRVVGPCGTLAIFPQPETEDAWEVDGEDLACTLNLNTIQMLKALAPAIEAELLVVLDDAENHVLYFKDTCAFKHWPMRRGDDEPYDLDGFPGLIEEWREAIENLAASVEKTGRTATISITNKDGSTTTATVSDGDTGPQGEKGEPGIGMPTGGAAGQVLVKASGADFDCGWQNGSGSVSSVNGKVGAVVLDAEDVGAAEETHASTHAADGSDPITPADIGALPSSTDGVDGYVMLFGGVQYVMQTAYTQSGVDGWGTEDGAWKLFVTSTGSALFMVDGAPKPASPNNVGGVPKPWTFTFLDGSGTAVVSDAGATSTEEIVGHLRSRENPHGVTAEQIGAAAAGDIPTALSQLSGDATHRVVTDAEKAAWNGKQGALTFDNAPTAGSANPVKSGGVKSALDGKLGTAGNSVSSLFNIFDSDGNGVIQKGANWIFGGDALGLMGVYGPIVEDIWFGVDGWHVGDDLIAKVSTVPYRQITGPITPFGYEASTRKVLTITATTAQSVTLPAIPNTDEVLNCDIVVNGTAATADFGLTLVGGTGVSVYYPDGEGITCKAGCVTMVSCVGINGLGWLVVGCNNLKTAS